MIRPPAVAGTFYAAEKEKLIKQIENSFKSKFGPGSLPAKKTSDTIFAGIVPHAGYMYSGPFAAHVYKKIAEAEKPETFVIIGPNHSGVGAPISIPVEGAWATPLGQVSIDSDLAKKIVQGGEAIVIDETAHLYEHSVEVQLPFLQYAFGSKKDSFKFVPICMMAQDELAAESVGFAIASVAKKEKLKEKITVIASSDFSHYEPAKISNPKDLAAIEAIKNLDVDSFYRIIQEKNVTACGFGPIAAAMIYAKEIGLKKGELLKYGDSGDTSGDKASVVGYAGIIFR